MSDFTDADFDRIELAMRDIGLSEYAFGRLKEKLRPKPKFAEGQVVCFPVSALGGDIDCYQVFNEQHDVRALTLTEMGPAVREMRSFLRSFIDNYTHGGTYESSRDLIKRFDEVHGDE